MRFRGIATGVLVLVFASACTSGSDPSPPSKPKVIAAADAQTMKEGRDFDLVATLPAKVDGNIAHYSGVSPDGMIFGATAEEDPNAEQPVVPGSSLVTTRADVFMLDPRTGKVTPISDGASRAEPVGVAGIDANDEWVVWVEVQDGFGARWTLHSYERSTGKERVLGSSKEAAKGDTSVDFEGPSISGASAVMSTFGVAEKDLAGNQVFTVPLDGSAALTELVGGASSVDADADGITFIDAATRALTFRDAKSGKTTILNVAKEDVEDYLECQLFHSRILFTCEGSKLEMSVHIKTSSGETTSIGPFDGALGYPDLDAGWARFVIDPDSDATIYAIDINRMKLFKVADTQGGWSLMGHGMALVQPFNGAKGDIKLIKLH